MRRLEQLASVRRHTPVFTLVGWLWPRVHPYRWVVLAALVALALQGFLEAYPVQLLRRVFHLITDPNAGFGSQLVWLVAAWYACALAAAGASILAAYLAACLSTSLGAKLRQHLHDHVQSLSVDFFEDRQSGDLLNRSVNDVAELQSYLTAPLTWVGDAIFSFGFAFYFLLQIDWQMTLICVPLGGLLLIMMYLASRLIRPVFRRYRETSSDIFNLFSEDVSGIREIQAFTREDSHAARYQATNEQLRNLEVRTAVIGHLLTTAFMVVFPLVTVMVLWQGGLRVHSGRLPVADLVSFLVYAGMLVRPLRGMGGHYARFQRAFISAERVMEVLKAEPRVSDAPGARELPRARGDIAFDCVSFSYDLRRPALNRVSLHIPAGQIAALVGPSGAGKTTLVKLLLRYYDPQEGCIRLDDVDLRQAALRSLRDQMGVVFQDPFIFSGSIADNIAFGAHETTRKAVIAAACAADLGEFIDTLPSGYDTLVGDRGVRLSAGQRARLAIARAVLRDPLVLVLDEATASVDTASEERIQKAVDRLMEGRTSVVVAHRLSTIKRADQIIVLSQGKLVQTGTHAELLAQGGQYWDLYYAQFSRQEPVASSA